MKRTLIAAAILGLALAAHADSSNGDPSDRGGPNDMFTDPASNCIEQSNAAFLAHFFPEHSFGGICGFVPPPSPSPRRRIHRRLGTGVPQPTHPI